MRRITLEAQRMSGLVDDMLRLARLDQHPGQQDEPVDLTALVQASAPSGPRSPTRTGPGAPASRPASLVTGDEELLRRAVDNLLANVRAHTPAGTTATITAAAGDGRWSSRSATTAPASRPTSFPGSSTASTAAAAPSRRPGSGLGLAIVTTVAAAHHGTAAAALNDPQRPAGHPHPARRASLARPARLTHRLRPARVRFADIRRYSPARPGMNGRKGRTIAAVRYIHGAQNVR